MEESGLWRLFFLTGLPEVWLAIRGQEEEKRREEMAMTAFSAYQREEKQV